MALLRYITSRGVLATALGCVLAAALLTAGPASAVSREFRLQLGRRA